ncbi:GAF and ANTAR domain-containing protein [Amycolatopsis pigmentata]|uniref:GAF and ANTAR domain-containing protein n=1 Tax=Amycolatopsis pigmentata TaxID=450801 RepID=A0ABW5FJR7_9PSEU
MAAEMPLADELGAMFARMSGLLLSRETVEEALRSITALAAEVFAGTTGAGVTLLDEHGERATSAATDPVVERLDSAQYQLGEGPCLTAWRQRTTIRIDDLREERRWPEWTAAVTGTGVRSALSVPLVGKADGLGALKVYATRPGVYGEREEQLLTMFAAQAAILLTNMRTAQDAGHISDALTEALRARDALSMAKGVIMGRDGVDERTAFLTLVEDAGRQGRTVRDAADELARASFRRRR